MLHSAVLRPVRLIRKLPAHDGIVRTCPIHHTAHINLHRNRPSISHIDRPAIVRKSEIQLLSHISMERCRRRIKRGIFDRMFSQIHFCNVHLLTGVLPRSADKRKARTDYAAALSEPAIYCGFRWRACVTYSKCFFYGGRCHKDCHAIVGYSSVFTMDHDICVKQDSHTGSPFNPTGSSTLRHRYQ